MKFPMKVISATAVFSLSAVFAQSLGLATASADDLGSFLVTAEGKSVYATIEDAPGAAGCDAACATYWPAVTSEGLATAGGALDAGLVGEIPRDDGTTQVTYNGWPLYYFHYDFAAGTTRGQGNAGLWYLVSPAGELVGYSAADVAAEEAEEAAELVVTDEFTQIMDLGEQVYARVCVACHGPNGEGGAGVRLISNSRLADAHAITDAVTHGLAYMPPLGGAMTAEETQAVLTFIRNSWDNSFGEVPLDLVEEVRGE